MSSPLHELGAVLRRAAPWAPDDTERVDAVLPSRPDTVVRGHLPTQREPAAGIPPGGRVRIDTVSHQGMVNGAHPIEFFAGFGVAADAVLDDVVAIYEQVRCPEGGDAHVLTGPIEVHGAEVGDAIEIRMLAADLRVPYGVNRSGPGAGVLPDLLPEVSARVLHLDDRGTRFPFGAGISVPAAPFPGFVAVTPPLEAGFVPSRPPGPWGGNLDMKWLTVGARLLLPVLQPGAGLYVGDPHAAQGDGEVNGTAIEHSSTYTVEVVLHRGLAPTWPVLLTVDRIVCTGVDADLHVALERALRSMIDLLVGYSEGALSPGDAYALCSLAADAGIAEAVNPTRVAYVALPTSVLDGAA